MDFVAEVKTVRKDATTTRAQNKDIIFLQDGTAISLHDIEMIKRQYGNSEYQKVLSEHAQG